ncbi:SDR family oxidoreductase [Deltaproteobacteria bacterium]|nr:SDR family oxidoreductase [Deltaproteobacteria bacterium]
MFRLDNKIAVVLGGGGGLGEACAVALSRQGATVIVASRGLEKLEGLADKIQAETGATVEAMRVDVSSSASLSALAEQVIQKYKTVDILVNAHGINVKMPAADVDEVKWDSLFATNVKGVMLACKTFGKIMIDNKKGKIINLSSVRGIRGTDGGNMTYGATKGSVDMITRMLAAEWAPYNINVNAIGPSVVMTEMAKKAIPPERLQILLSKTLFKRFITPEDVGAACVYLASGEADNVTGLILYVDGGLTAVG